MSNIDPADDGGFSAALEEHISNCEECEGLERLRKTPELPDFNWKEIDRQQQKCFEAAQEDKRLAHEARLDDEADRTNDERWAERNSE